jgi:ATP-dependent helicase HrpB
MAQETLPIDMHLAGIAEALVQTKRVVLSAPPGSGKTTRVPPALLALFPGDIVVLEPRKLAARMAAKRVAEELGETVGKRVGYTVRFDDQSSSETRIRFVTEGILSRRFLSDPSLKGTSVVILDEFHERHLQGDTALALVRALMKTRSDLHLLVMSATLDGLALAEALNAVRIETEGRPFPVTLEHTEGKDERPLALRVASAVRALLAETTGHVLVFLPGAREIRECLEACTKLAREHNAVTLALHGDLSPDEQDRVVKRSQERKVIFSTNVAESSITIDGVSGVVDSGLARVANVDAWTGLSALQTGSVSQASCTQRAGRAGRTGPGRAIRLYSRGDFERRPMSDVPEILRADLASTALETRALHTKSESAEALPWLTPPPERAWVLATDLLKRIGILDASDDLTAFGKRAANVPVHPRLAALLLRASDASIPQIGALAAALLSEREIRQGARGLPQSRSNQALASAASDLETQIDLFVEAGDLNANILRTLNLDVSSVRAVDRARKQLLKFALRAANTNAGASSLQEELWKADPLPLRRALLQAYPDRVAKRTKSGGRGLAIAGAGVAELSEESCVRYAPWMIALSAESKGTSALVRLASAIEPEWLIDAFPEAIEERTEASWESAKERVSAVHRMLFQGLVLDESKASEHTEAAAELLFKMASQRGGLAAFCEDGAITHWKLRTELAAEIDARVKPVTGEDLARILREACSTCRSFEDLREAQLAQLVKAQTEGGPRVAELAPERVTLPSGRQVSIQYESGKPPFIESYLQDFCGLTDTPKAGSKPLVVHLLAPNKRAVQVTTDLASFWKNHYPAIRKELSRKYPRHAWPEDPRTPVPAKHRL